MAKLLQRVIALDLRARRFGYVVYEGSNLIIDWGMRTYRNGDRALLEFRLNHLRSTFAPSIILIRKTMEHHRLGQSMIRHALRTVKAFAKRASIAVHVIDSSSMQRFFSR